MAAKHKRMRAANKRRELFSLWLMPRGQSAVQLQALIEKLSRAYSTPAFQPHVTLIGGINLSERVAIRKTDEVAARVKPFRIRLSEVTYLDEYFRCVFIKARRTRSLLNAYHIARAVFGTGNHEEYMPHLSLIYADLSNEQRQNIIGNIGCNVEILFIAKEIFLYSTAGRPKNWYCVSKSSFDHNS
jgi:2'-5' RNA ligase